MSQKLSSSKIEIGYHPDGYRIDKTASPLNFYTKWEISESGEWSNPKPVDFADMPEKGWFKSDGFQWEG